MMLFIKLPKGKTAKAFERAAEHCSQRIKVCNTRYLFELERWRIDAAGHAWGVHEDGAPERPREIMLLTETREGYLKAADACGHSTGDVYLGRDEWEKIKGYYS